MFIYATWQFNNKAHITIESLSLHCVNKINSLMLYIREPPERISDANTYKDGSQIQKPSSNREDMITSENVKS